jgi:hypothetical protein
VPYALSPLSPSATPCYPSFITSFLLLGDARDALNHSQLLRLGVTHVLNAAAHTPPPPFQDDFFYLHLPLQDTPEQPLLSFLPAAVGFIMDARASGGLVLVHCQMGISRSVACVMAYLCTPGGGGMTLAAAWQHVRARRPISLPNSGFRTQLALWEMANNGGASSVVHLERVEGVWDTREWRGHSDRLRELAREEEAARVLEALGWAERAKRAVQAAAGRGVRALRQLLGMR